MYVLLGITTNYNLLYLAIHQAMSCFPSSLTWLVRQLKTGLSEKKKVSVEEVHMLLFT
jgi:hypothetical protein